MPVASKLTELLGSKYQSAGCLQSLSLSRRVLSAAGNAIGEALLGCAMGLGGGLACSAKGLIDGVTSIVSGITNGITKMHRGISQVLTEGVEEFSDGALEFGDGIATLLDDVVTGLGCGGSSLVVGATIAGLTPYLSAATLPSNFYHACKDPHGQAYFGRKGLPSLCSILSSCIKA